jgi:hypothetical protein
MLGHGLDHEEHRLNEVLRNVIAEMISAVFGSFSLSQLVALTNVLPVKRYLGAAQSALSAPGDNTVHLARRIMIEHASPLRIFRDQVRGIVSFRDIAHAKLVLYFAHRRNPRTDRWTLRFGPAKLLGPKVDAFPVLTERVPGGGRRRPW